MRNISLGQVIILIMICFLLFGDLRNIRKQVKLIINNFKDFISNEKQDNRKKGT